MKNEKNFNKIWPGIGEAVCTIPQACREVFFQIFVFRKLKIFMLFKYWQFRNHKCSVVHLYSLTQIFGFDLMQIASYFFNSN